MSAYWRTHFCVNNEIVSSHVQKVSSSENVAIQHKLMLIFLCLMFRRIQSAFSQALKQVLNAFDVVYHVCRHLSAVDNLHFVACPCSAICHRSFCMSCLLNFHSSFSYASLSLRHMYVNDLRNHCLIMEQPRVTPMIP